MLKKFILLATSVAALLALAAPAAQATGPLITNAAGEAAKTITARSSNTLTHTAVGTLECTTVKLHGSIAENVNTTARGTGTGIAEGDPKVPSHTGHCRSGELLFSIPNVAISSLHLTRHGGETTGTASLSLTYSFYTSATSLIMHCTFGGSVPVKRTGANSINVNGEIIKSAGSAFCPTAGVITGDFTVFDEAGLPVTIH